jgi:hypothetical protein
VQTGFNRNIGWGTVEKITIATANHIPAKRRARLAALFARGLDVLNAKMTQYAAMPAKTHK